MSQSAFEVHFADRATACCLGRSLNDMNACRAAYVANSCEQLQGAPSPRSMVKINDAGSSLLETTGIDMLVDAENYPTETTSMLKVSDSEGNLLETDELSTMKKSKRHAVGNRWLQGLKDRNQRLLETRSAFLKIAPLTMAWFMVFSLRVLVLSSRWESYVPVVSPVFGSGKHWAASRSQSHAIMAHVLSGVIAFASGIVQLDKSIRHSKPMLHRWIGRLYMCSGLIMVISLRPLWSTSGSSALQGGAQNISMRLFIDVASLAWILSTGLAWVQAAIKRDFESHRRWAMTSIALLLTPLAQRFFLISVVPCLMVFRLVFDAAVYGVPLWHSSWGPGTALFFGPPTAPRVLSFDGYGVAENAIFPVSAWAGLMQVGHGAYIFAWAGGELGSDVVADASIAESLRHLLGSDLLKAIQCDLQGPLVRCAAALIISVAVLPCSMILIIGNAVVTAAIASMYFIFLFVPGLVVAMGCCAVHFTFSTIASSLH